MIRLFKWVGPLVAIAALAAPAHATTVLAVPLSQMAKESDVIVRARVGEQRVEWDKRRERILTLTTLEVIDGLRGAKRGELLTVYQVGGEKDGRVMRIAGAISLAPGEEIVFFGKRFNDYVVSYGMGLGKLVVGYDGDKAFVSPSYGDVSFVQRRGTTLEPTTPPMWERRPLSELVDEVTRALRSGGAR